MDLQKAPSGILGWLQLKVTGRNPPGFGDSVVGVIEVGDNYAATSELQTQVDNAASALSGNQSKTFTVPNGKVWRVLGAGGYMVMNAADVALIVEGNISIAGPNSGVFTVPIFAFATQQLGTFARIFGTTFRPPLFLPSGWQILVGKTLSGPVTIAGVSFSAIWYQEFDL